MLFPGFYKKLFFFPEETETVKGKVYTQSNLEGKKDLLISHFIYSMVSARQIFSAFCYEFCFIHTPPSALLNIPCQYKLSELLEV